MKKLFYLILGGLLSAGLASCEKETKLYDGEEGIYFSVQFGPEHGNEQVWAHQQVTPVEFINLHGEADTLALKVMITGRIKDYDRHFSVEVVSDTTTARVGVDYQALEPHYTIKAGEYFTHIPLVVYRTEEIRTEKKALVLRLIPNEHFSIGIPEWKRLPNYWQSTVAPGDFRADMHKVELSDFVIRPSEWIGLENDGLEAGMWGVFTEKKYRLICDHFGLVYEDFTSPTTMPQARKANIREYMARYLQELYDQGTPILEEDGRLMWFMGVSWSSRVGVPWNGII